ncbi:unnamed protein product [Anisakis simplex]|uniref:BTB domain-containing protein n=1 Tax=Anisakis simplex TaxID=6269 RepID=A0A0M3J126_ANISI|nr:unnamed protein product [Anisakis simplex]
MEIANGGISALPLEDKICDEEPLDSVFIDDSRESEDTIQFSARRPPVNNSPSNRESISTTHNQQLIPKRTRATVSMRDDETDMWGSEEVDHKEEFTLTLTDPDHRNALLDRLNTFRRNRELCDVVLFVREKEILAHKVLCILIQLL